MKKLCLVALLFCLSAAVPARAQVLDLGLKVGAGTSAFAGAEASRSARLWGRPAGGVTLGYPLEPGLTLRAELLYLARSGKTGPAFNDAGRLTQGDLDLIGGAGLRVPLSGKVAGTLEARYDLGVGDIDANSAEARVLRNRSFILLAGVSVRVDRSAWGFW